MDVAEVERELITDLDTLDDRLRDERFSAALYRALTRNAWRKHGGPDGGVALSFGRAEEIVNELRGRHGNGPIELAQTGGEGQVSRTVADELGRLGWHASPQSTGQQDPRHSGKPVGSPPPREPSRRAPPPA